MENRRLPHYDIDQLTGNDDHFHDLLPAGEYLHLFVGKRELTDFIVGGAGRNYYLAAQFAIHLHRNLDLVFFRERGIVSRPWSLQQIRTLAHLLPKLVSKIGSEG